MSFSGMRFELSYNNQECDVIHEFLNPALKQAVEYDRAVGFFSSTALMAVSIGIENELINNQYIKTVPIKKSRKIIMQSILDESSVESYLSGTSSEATIYRVVMVNSGISSDDKPDNVKKLLGIFNHF